MKYIEQVKRDIKKWIEDNGDYLNLGDFKNARAFGDYLFDRLWEDDSVTGRVSGSYTGNALEAKENILNDIDTAIKALDDVYYDMRTITEKFLREEWEYFDVETRCFVLSDAVDEVAKEIFEQKEKGKERMENKVAICADLLKTLQKTNDGKNITDLVYAKSTNTDDEHVIIVWSNGDEKAVEIGGDRDGIRMIRDITRVIYYGKEN